MLIDVITRVAADTGINLVQKRTTLIELANQAAREMHKELECNKINREVTLVCPPDKVISLPSFIGEVRGTRIHTNEIPFDINSLGQPRYVTNTLGYKFKNWRDLGESSVHTLPSQTGKLTLVPSGIEDDPVVVLVEGETTTSHRVAELCLMNNVTITTNLFTQNIDTIACVTKGRKYNIVINDTDGNEIAILYNTFPKTRYKLMDVSQIFWPLDTAAGESLIDVMYKLPAINLYNDADSFYAGDDYDEAWYNMCMFFHLKPLQNRLNDAVAHRAACLDFLQSAKDSGENGIVKKLSFGRNKFYGLFRRYKWMPGAITNVDHYPPGGQS